MRCLHKKLWRDLLAMKGQVIAISAVVAAGVMTLLMTVTNLEAIRASRDHFYQDYRFADVFSELKRAPESVAELLEEIPGVNRVETRVKAPVRLRVPGFADPVRGHLLSLPDDGVSLLNRLHVRQGRLPDPGRTDEIVVSDAFAEAHGLQAGDKLFLIIRGRLEEMVVVGTVLSPEYVYQTAPTDLLPDYQRYGIIWMNRKALANSFAMDGAFNAVAISLQSGVSVAPVIAGVDRILERYGGLGAYGREDQLSHRFLAEEIDQLKVMATLLPLLFLSVATFLIHVLLGRILRTQREQIAVLKAFGFSNREIGFHYGQFAAIVVILGTVLGLGLGVWSGRGLANLYLEYYRFPIAEYRTPPQTILLSFLVAGAAASLGALGAVRSSVRLPPAEAMRPPAPESYRTGWWERTALSGWLGQPNRIILRNLSRHPWKTFLSVAGIGLSGALLMVGSFQFHAVDHLIDIQYRLVQKMDLHISFNEPVAARALVELREQPGVLYAEGYRSVPVRLHRGLREYHTNLLGLETESHLRGVLDEQGRQAQLLPGGLLLTSYLAEMLALEIGDPIGIELLEGRRRTVYLPLAGTVDEPLGVGAYLERSALNYLMREGPALSGSWLLTDSHMEPDLLVRLQGMPAIAGIGMITQSKNNLRQYIDDTMLMLMGILLLLASSITFAVIYNNARITLAERTRELATLRVMGYSRAEVSWILVGEAVLLAVLAIPLAWASGSLFAWLLQRSLAMDMFRIPFVMTPSVFAFAAAGILLASFFSLLLVSARLRKIDMVSALKANE